MAITICPTNTTFTISSNLSTFRKKSLSLRVRPAEAAEQIDMNQEATNNHVFKHSFLMYTTQMSNTPVQEKMIQLRMPLSLVSLVLLSCTLIQIAKATIPQMISTTPSTVPTFALLLFSLFFSFSRFFSAQGLDSSISITGSAAMAPSAVQCAVLFHCHLFLFFPPFISSF